MITKIGYYYYELNTIKEIFYVYKIDEKTFRSRVIVSSWRIPEFKDDDDNVGFLDWTYSIESKSLTNKHIQFFIKDIFDDKRIFIERN